MEYININDNDDLDEINTKLDSYKSNNTRCCLIYNGNIISNLSTKTAKKLLRFISAELEKKKFLDIENVKSAENKITLANNSNIHINTIYHYYIQQILPMIKKEDRKDFEIYLYKNITQPIFKKKIIIMYNVFNIINEKDIYGIESKREKLQKYIEANITEEFSPIFDEVVMLAKLFVKNGKSLDNILLLNKALNFNEDICKKILK